MRSHHWLKRNWHWRAPQRDCGWAYSPLGEKAFVQSQIFYWRLRSLYTAHEYMLDEISAHGIEGEEG